MKKAEQKVIVIGGGIIGASSAYYLNQSGWKVTLIDQKQFGDAASYGNCGLILPGHVLPLNLPGTFFKAFKWMLDPAAPFYVKPRLDFNLFSWFLKFLLRCNKKHLKEAATARSSVLKAAVSLFDELIQQENIKCDWTKDGVHYLFSTREEFENYRNLDAFIAQFGTKAEEVSTQEFIKREPTFRSDIAGSWFYEGAAHLRPDYLMKELKRVLQDQGVSILENIKINSFSIENKKIISANSATETFKADEFVLSTGAWTSKFNHCLNCKIPIQPGKGYSITMDQYKSSPKTACILEEAGAVATPWPSGFRLAGTMEFSGFDETINPKRLASLSKNTNQFLPFSCDNTPKETRFDWRPMTYTGLPIIDRIPKYKNMTLAAGHNMIGLSMGPATGKMVTALLNETEPDLDMKPFRYFQ